MRIQHIAQAARGWPDDTDEAKREDKRILDKVEQHIHWRLWHGQVQRALDLIGETRAEIDAGTQERSV